MSGKYYYETSDIIGCSVNFETGSVHFRKNPIVLDQDQLIKRFILIAALAFLLGLLVGQII